MHNYNVKQNATEVIIKCYEECQLPLFAEHMSLKRTDFWQVAMGHKVNSMKG
jgi:hypothetical protein